MRAGCVAAEDGWMSRYMFVVHSNAAEGREQEYNDYMAGHVDDILALPGVIWGRRGTVAKAQARPAPDAHQYITVFEVETDDQIGRASCRERVCKYLSISVAAVYLKKNIKSTLLH